LRGKDLSRLFFVHDARGERQLDEQALPLSVGGDAAADIVMPGVPADQLVACVERLRGAAPRKPAPAPLPSAGSKS